MHLGVKVCRAAIPESWYVEEVEDLCDVRLYVLGFIVEEDGGVIGADMGEKPEDGHNFPLLNCNWRNFGGKESVSGV